MVNLLCEGTIMPLTHVLSIPLQLTQTVGNAGSDLVVLGVSSTVHIRMHVSQGQFRTRSYKNMLLLLLMRSIVLEESVLIIGF